MADTESLDRDWTGSLYLHRRSDPNGFLDGYALEGAPLAWSISRFQLKGLLKLTCDLIIPGCPSLSNLAFVHPTVQVDTLEA